MRTRTPNTRPLGTRRAAAGVLALAALVTLLPAAAAAQPATAAAAPAPASAAPAAPAPDSSSTWPATVVGFEQLEPVTRFQLQVRGVVAKGAVTGPTVVRALVDAQGRVQRVVLHTSCGNGDLDEAVLHAMRDMAFKPHMAGGQAVPVTLLAPVHVPKRLGRS